MARTPMNFANASVLSRWTLTALVLGLIGSSGALWQRDVLLTQLDDQQQQRRHLERRLNHQQWRDANTVQQDPKATAAIQQVATELQRPWEAMLDALQQSAAPDMVITRLQPESDGLRLQVSGQAESSAAFLAYVQRLRNAGVWAEVVPVSEELGTSLVLPGGKPLSFQLLAEWKGRS